MKYIFFLLLFFLPNNNVDAQPNRQLIHHISYVRSPFNPDSAATALINTVPQSVRNKADSYCEGGYWLLLWNFLYAVFIAWLFLFAGLSGRIKKMAGNTKSTGWRNVIYISLYFSLSFLLTLPIDIYQNFIREQYYGFSNQDFIQWLSGDLLTFFVELILAVPVLVFIYFIFRKVKQNWWLWGAVIAIFFCMVVLIIYPVFIAPMFNQYTALKNGPLKDKIMSMAKANGVSIDGVYVYNESQQTKAFNANVTGFGSTAQIALNDNMLQHCTDTEIKAGLAHEMGHYVLNHLIKLALEFSFLIVVGFGAVKLLFDILLVRYGKRWNLTSVQDAASLPVLLFLFTAYFFIITPISNSLIRATEINADSYGLNAAREPDAFASLCLKTADNHKIAPGYLEEIFFFDHPSRQHRIMSAMRWKDAHSSQK